MFLVFNKRVFNIFFSFCALIISSTLIYYSTQLVSAVPMNSFCVVLDAGHGGIDGGSRGSSGVYERDINLSVSKKIEKLLKEMNIKVVQTRKTEDGLYGVFASGFKKRDMQERRKIIQRAKADLVVSIHMNYFEDSSARGAQVFYKPNNISSRELAESLQSLFEKNLPNARKSAQKGDFYILTSTETPGILIECGYLSNKEEEKLLISNDYQNKLAYQIFCGIVGFFGDNKSA